MWIAPAQVLEGGRCFRLASAPECIRASPIKRNPVRAKARASRRRASVEAGS